MTEEARGRPLGRVAEMKAAFDAKPAIEDAREEGNRFNPRKSRVAVALPFPFPDSRPRSKTVALDETRDKPVEAEEPMYRQPGFLDMSALDATLPAPLTSPEGRNRAETLAHDWRPEEPSQSIEDKELPQVPVKDEISPSYPEIIPQMHNNARETYYDPREDQLRKDREIAEQLQADFDREAQFESNIEANGYHPVQTAGRIISESAGDSGHSNIRSVDSFGIAVGGGSGSNIPASRHSDPSSVAATVRVPDQAQVPEFDENGTPLDEYGFPIVNDKADKDEDDFERYSDDDSPFNPYAAYGQYYQNTGPVNPLIQDENRPVHGENGLTSEPAPTKPGLWKRIGKALKGESKGSKPKKKGKEKAVNAEEENDIDMGDEEFTREHREEAVLQHMARVSDFRELHNVIMARWPEEPEHSRGTGTLKRPFKLFNLRRKFGKGTSSGVSKGKAKGAPKTLPHGVNGRATLSRRASIASTRSQLSRVNTIRDRHFGTRFRPAMALSDTRRIAEQHNRYYNLQERTVIEVNGHGGNVAGGNGASSPSSSLAAQKNMVAVEVADERGERAYLYVPHQTISQMKI